MSSSAVLRQRFDLVDSDGTGSITAPQLQKALEDGNLDFSISIVEQMIRMYDFDRSGTMSFGEFVTLNNFILKVQQAFSYIDRGEGFLAEDDIHQALVKLGFSLDCPALLKICESFDLEKNGKFHLDDFTSLAIFLQSAQNLFNSFDTAKEGRVTLDLNQFIYCDYKVALVLRRAAATLATSDALISKFHIL